MKCATAYKRSDGWYFQSDSQTTVGVWMATPPFLKLSTAASSTALGEAALTVLNASCNSVPHPNQDQWDEVFQPMLELANVRSERQFERGTKCLGLDTEGEWLTIEPMINEGPTKGFSRISAKAVRLTLESSPRDIGEALQQAALSCI
jgi:hypothetical protein